MRSTRLERFRKRYCIHPYIRIYCFTMSYGLLNQMTALADPIRSRIVAILASQELSVSELQAVLQLPQSTVSRHLKTLAKEGLVVARSEGTTHLYHAPVEQFAPTTARLWQVVQGEVDTEVTSWSDRDRLRMVLAERHRQSQEFFESRAGQWDRMREELFGPRLELFALAGLLDRSWTVGDLGTGTGQLAATVAPFVEHVIAVDESPAMLEAARTRVADHENVELRRGKLEDLPIDDCELDLAILSLVLPYAVDPSRVIARAGRALVPGGRVIILDLAPHDRAEYRQTMGHLWQGFGEGDISHWMREADLEFHSWSALPPEPGAKGPALMVATGMRSGRPRRAVA